MCKDWATHFIVFGPTAAAHKLFPSVLVINGKTLIVSSAGKMTTMLAAKRTAAKMKIEVLSVSKPIVKLAKFRFTDDRVPAPKKDAADVPKSR